MTDEEKANDYAIGKAHEHYNFLFEENSGSPIDFAKLCWLDGLTEGRKEGYEQVKKNYEEDITWLGVVKLLIATLNDTTWDEGHSGYADSEPGYRCPNCSCKDCYRVSCKYNESELFKKIYKRFPELYENI